VQIFSRSYYARVILLRLTDLSSAFRSLGIPRFGCDREHSCSIRIIAYVSWKTEVLLQYMFFTYAQSSELYLLSAIYLCCAYFYLGELPPTTGHRVANLPTFPLFTLTAIYACAFSLVSIYFANDFHRVNYFSLSPVWVSRRKKPLCFG
jgi:hypothetical protein